MFIYVDNREMADKGDLSPDNQLMISRMGQAGARGPWIVCGLVILVYVQDRFLLSRKPESLFRLWGFSILCKFL